MIIQVLQNLQPINAVRFKVTEESDAQPIMAGMACGIIILCFSSRLRLEGIVSFSYFLLL